MKARVIKRFKDKYSGQIREVGDVFTCKRERFEEILKVAPLIEEIKAEKPKKPAK